MVILLVTWTHPFSESNGVSHAAKLHVEYLRELGHKVVVVCPLLSQTNLDDVTPDIVYITAKGNGSLFKFHTFDHDAASDLITLYRPDLVLCESWQNSMTENFVNICFKCKVPCVVISHGISLHPFSAAIKSIARSIQWLVYWSSFKRKLSKISALTVLSLNYTSNRFYDGRVARKKGVKIFELTNTAYNLNNIYIPYAKRNGRILIVGYFSDIKNQLRALRLASHPALQSCEFVFIGEKAGSYYDKCINYANLSKLKNVIFLNDKECSIKKELSECILLLSTSITEVLPLVILEGMSAGTPFLAPNVGLIPDLKGGLVCFNDIDFVEKIQTVTSNAEVWEMLSEEARHCFDSYYKPDVVKQQLSAVVEYFDRKN